MTEDEGHVLKLGPWFIYNYPKMAARRRNIELATLQRKIEARFFERKVHLGRAVEQFINELNSTLRTLHSATLQTRQRNKPVKQRRTYDKIVKRLQRKLRANAVIIQQTDRQTNQKYFIWAIDMTTWPNPRSIWKKPKRTDASTNRIHSQT